MNKRKERGRILIMGELYNALQFYSLHSAIVGAPMQE